TTRGTDAADVARCGVAPNRAKINSSATTAASPTPAAAIRLQDPEAALDCRLIAILLAHQDFELERPVAGADQFRRNREVRDRRPQIEAEGQRILDALFGEHLVQIHRSRTLSTDGRV